MALLLLHSPDIQKYCTVTITMNGEKRKYQRNNVMFLLVYKSVTTCIQCSTLIIFTSIIVSRNL